MVHLVTCQVMTAVLHPEFRKLAVHFPTPSEKEKAKDWVQAHSCKAWRRGWCFVDGTLFPLSNRPYWYGESYFDQKCNYSLNIQVFIYLLLLSCVADNKQIVSLPKLHIIDFSYGHTGSTHESSAWEDTCLSQGHEALLTDGEWVWADSEYPINIHHMHIN